MTTNIATKTLRVIHVPQNDDEDVTVRYIEPGFQSLQAQVEGLIECVSGLSDIDLWCNDGARLTGMTTNKRATRLAVGLDIMSPTNATLAPLVGPVVVAAVNGDGKSLGLPNDKIGPILTELVAHDGVIDPSVNASSEPRLVAPPRCHQATHLPRSPPASSGTSRAPELARPALEDQRDRFPLHQQRCDESKCPGTARARRRCSPFTTHDRPRPSKVTGRAQHS